MRPSTASTSARERAPSFAKAKLVLHSGINSPICGEQNCPTAAASCARSGSDETVGMPRPALAAPASAARACRRAFSSDSRSPPPPARNAAIEAENAHPLPCASASSAGEPKELHLPPSSR